ncbi:MAG: acyclic terpene utilization AtuA family protein [Acidobacteriota bacterium]
MTDDVLRVANCSGFYGDRLSGAKEMVEGGPIDVLTGDYLAELTMLILLKDKAKDAERGYARTFLRQLQQIARTCSERDIKIVVNAGGMNPSGLADASQRLLEAEGLDGKVAYIEGDDILDRLDELQAQGETLAHFDRGMPLSDLEDEVLSANVYLGGWGIVEALSRNADLVLCPRVTDAAVVVGPSAWRFGWQRTDWDQLAGAVVAGHIIECSAQATGGNYSFFHEIDSLERPGFPIAEMHADGSFVVTKHEGTDGEVSVGTVTAQLLYEVQNERYFNPDVVVRMDTIRLEQEGKDRVRVWGIRGEPAPDQLKVCMNYLGGYKNSMTFMLPGLDAAKKAEVAERAFWSHVGGEEQFEETKTTFRRGGEEGHENFALLTVAARDRDDQKVGRKFWNAAIEMALANYPGFQTVHSSRVAQAISIYWPALVGKDKIDETVVIGDERIAVPPAPAGEPVAIDLPERPEGTAASGTTRQAPLGAIAGARSGDKGGNANVGFWTRSAEAYLWLEEFLTEDKLRDLYPEAAALEVRRTLLPNFRAMNFVLVGLLGYGVAASLRPDPQAKMVGEEIRNRKVPIPESLLGHP